MQVFRVTQLQEEAKPRVPALTARAHAVAPPDGVDIPREVNTAHLFPGRFWAGVGSAELTVKRRVFGSPLSFVGVPKS